ncbi:bromodomain and WD repeat-containing protein 3 isoform X1 [Tanacetum coccineum]
MSECFFLCVLDLYDHYGILKRRQVSQFPVPLTLDVIQLRLENNYYRRFAAMKHDVEVLLQNAEAYSGEIRTSQ